jgi:hypothetical protein
MADLAVFRRLVAKESLVRRPHDAVDTGTSYRIAGQGSVVTDDFSLPENYYIVRQTFDGTESDTLSWKLIDNSDKTEADNNHFSVPARRRSLAVARRNG